MEEILIRDYLKRGKSMSDSEFEGNMRNMLSSRKYNMRKYEMEPSYRRYSRRMHGDTELMDMLDSLDHNDKMKLMEMLQSEEMYTEGTINETQAKYLVEHMFHTAGGKKYVGEKYDMQKAKEVHDRYKNMFTSEASVFDVYIAINAQYHDYCELFKSWFGTNIDTRIIESAITFWFKDVDYTGESKVYDYFMGS